MDKNIIKQFLNKTFVSEAKKETNGTPGVSLAKKIGSQNKKINTKGVGDIAKDMKSYEKGSAKSDTNKSEAPNKFNYTGEAEKEYHDQMEIRNGQEMIQYDREPSSQFKDRAMEAIEGSTRMGNNPEWANVVAKGQGGDPEFGKNLVKTIKAAEAKRAKQTPTTKMFGDDWEVVDDKSHKSYAFESTKGKSILKEGDFSDYSNIALTDMIVNLSRFENNEELIADIKAELDRRSKMSDSQVDPAGDDYERLERQAQSGINPYMDIDETTNKNKPQIKESMKRLKFKKEFNGVGNALKLIPESYKVDKKVFEMTDGTENYRIRWEGSINEGKAVILMASDKNLVNEDMQKMKRLMGYKSEETIGTLKGSERLNENKAFSTIWDKTKKLMAEAEENEGDDSEHGDWDDAVTSQSPEAKKHIQGSTSSDKGTSAKASTGHFDEVKPTSPEAKKHVQGSTSSDKGTQAPKPKTGNLEDAVGHAPEAKAHMSQNVKKKVNEAEDPIETDDEDENDEMSDKLDSIKRKDAYDASLDVEDPEDKETKLTKTDLEKPTTPTKFVGTDTGTEEDDDIDIPEIVPGATYKLMRNKNNEFAIIMTAGSRKEFVTMVPDKYLDLARQDAESALEAMRADREEADDEELMETLNKMISETPAVAKKNK